ncbi:MAG: hypothetical protein M0R66_05245 [Candidatus Omnitrophica bacterium]|nr:hypothetical protein [Candidatus Omnitrophota bacterium]
MNKTRITIAVILLLLFLFANIYAIRQLTRYGVELYFYDKMLVAYQIGGMRGLNEELESVLLQKEMPRQLAVAKTFEKNLGDLKAPDKFLRDVTGDLRKKIDLYRMLRIVAFVLILIIFLFRLVINLSARAKITGGKL